MNMPCDFEFFEFNTKIPIERIIQFILVLIDNKKLPILNFYAPSKLAPLYLAHRDVLSPLPPKTL